MLGPARVRAEHDGQPACAYTALPQETMAVGRTGQDIFESRLWAAELAEGHVHD